MNVADYMAKVYPNPPCWALVADVYTSELDEPVENYKTVSSSIRDIASAFRLALHKSPHGFQQLEAPADFAVVLMAGRTSLGMHHAGIFYQGRVLHAQPTGTLYQDLASLADQYPLMEFWGK